MSTARKTSAPYAVIAGLGATGLSCARYLREHGWRLAVTDTRLSPPQLPALAALDPSIPVRLGGLDTALLADAERVIASPGLPLAAGCVKETRRGGHEVVDGVEL
jgi:UDP-N-acetylmuramoylalanine--D-glutamate ligase